MYPDLEIFFGFVHYLNDDYRGPQRIICDLINDDISRIGNVSCRVLCVLLGVNHNSVCQQVIRKETCALEKTCAISRLTTIVYVLDMRCNSRPDFRLREIAEYAHIYLNTIERKSCVTSTNFASWLAYFSLETQNILIFAENIHASFQFIDVGNEGQIFNVEKGLFVYFDFSVNCRGMRLRGRFSFPCFAESIKLRFSVCLGYS